MKSCLAVDLVNNELWWKGPSFLQNAIDKWPDIPTTYEEGSADEELVKKPLAITFTLTNTTDQQIKVANLEKAIQVERFGSKLKLLRVTAQVKFIGMLCKAKENGGRQDSNKLSAQDLQAAEELWIKSVQLSGFPNEHQKLLCKGGFVSFKELDLFLDDKGVIQCRGRLGRASIPSCSKNPSLLPTKHWFTNLVIRDHHQLVHHNGIREILNSIRQIHWIL